MRELAQTQADAQQFLRNFQSAFTTRTDGSTWPKWERTWCHASHYFRGLLRTGSSTITDIAAQLHTNQEQLERFIRESAWDHATVEAELRDRVPAHVLGSDAALIVDGMGIPKSGDHSVGVGRQWCGTTGKVDNCQVTVNCTLARPGERQNADQVTWPLGMQLYLPKQWASNDESVFEDSAEQDRYRQLRETADIPASIEYLPKYQIAANMIKQIVATGPDHACVVGDTNYGKHLSFRSSLRELDEPYVLGVEPTRFVVIPEETEIIDPDKAGPGRKHAAFRGDVETETPTEVADRVGDHGAWTRVCWNEGTKEALSGEFYRERVRVVKRTHQRWVTDETGWLLVKNCEDDEDQERDVRAWFCWGVDEASLEELVSWAQLRWTVERFHQDIKQELGADEYQGRTWTGFHHHLAVVMVAHAFVASQRLRTGTDRTRLASFETVVRLIVRESAIQQLINAHGFDRAKATAVALDMLRGYSDW